VTPPVAAVIPVLNEAGAIGPTVRGLSRAHVGLVVVVDGGSRDATVAEAGDAGAEVLVETRRGYGQACASGAALAASRGAEVVVFLDGDGADVPEMLPALTGPVLDGSRDFVIASRTRGVREPGSMSWHQVAAGAVIGAAVGLACGTRYTDMCAFRAIRADTLARLGMREMGYGWNLEMQMRAAAAGLRILEVPVPYRRRIAGESKVSGNLSGTLRAGSRILQVLVRVTAETRRERRGHGTVVKA
jgi:glycosyltransferase involved in cell wall biosynthesis